MAAGPPLAVTVPTTGPRLLRTAIGRNRSRNTRCAAAIRQRQNSADHNLYCHLRGFVICNEPTTCGIAAPIQPMSAHTPGSVLLSSCTELVSGIEESMRHQT